MMGCLLKSEDYNGDDYDLLTERVDGIVSSLFVYGDDKVRVSGYFGLYNGPKGLDVVVEDEAQLRRFICSQDEFELDFIEEDISISELQRYSQQWSMDVEAGCVLLKQWHHDGCNIFMLQPLDEKDEIVKVKKVRLEW